jgi:hypothetical protein
MMDIIEKKIYADGEPYFFNTETGEKYGEIVGAIAWPETEEGFLMVGAVDLFENADPEARHIRVLAEANESNIDVLLKRAVELQRYFSPFMGIVRFYGDPTSPTIMELLDRFNRDRRSRGLNPFYLTEAPQVRGPHRLELYARLIRSYTQPGRKTLHFCDTILPGYLRGLSPDEISENMFGHPPVAALGYALAVLSTWRPRKGGKRQEEGGMEVMANTNAP